MLKITKDQLMAKWFVCRITSSRKSAQYGLRFSYPLYISLVALGIFLVNPYILLVTALIAFFGIILPMHPFDYVYNFLFHTVFNLKKIPGRGSELQMNSVAAFLFNLGVIISLLFGVQLNYLVMGVIYVVISIFFIVIHLFTDDFSIYNFLPKNDK